MASPVNKSIRCAIYTRKSTEHGLELEFNSLDAQREACEAYIKSQAALGWRVLPERYDDPAYSGGNLERPALKRLLADIDGGRVDVIVVYKIDRLTRSLADFAKLVVAFDAKSISFVAVTQQFNTTSSMGRLTLNVLLSFAQFERELSSERVRDKIAASRRKGKWTGGSIPLGYDVRDKKLVPNPTEQKTVQYIFRRYLDLGSFQKLIADLDHNNIVTKQRQAETRAASGGIPFTYGPLAYLLKNRIYLGEMGHKDLWFPGEQAAIVDRKLFDEVQMLLASNAVQRTKRRSQSGALLMGKLYDDRGNRMSPSFSSKNGVRYRFYVSAALLRGRKAEAGSVSRVAAPDIEAAVMMAVRQHDQSDPGSSSEVSIILDHVARVEIGSTGLRIKLRPIPLDADGSNSQLGDEPQQSETIIEWPWQSPAKPATTENQILPCDETNRPNPNLVQAIVRSHAWVRQLTDGTYASIEQLAQASQLHPKIVRQSIKMAFLPPETTESILRGGDYLMSVRMTRLDQD